MSERKKQARQAVTRAYTINLKKLCHKTSFKKKAPKAMKKIRKFAQQAMGTKDVRLDVQLNKSVWRRVSDNSGPCLPEGLELQCREFAVFQTGSVCTSPENGTTTKMQLFVKT